MKKINFNELNKISDCPSIWEGNFCDGSFCLIKYDNDELDVYCSNEKIELNNCNIDDHLLLSIEDILNKPECGHINEDVLHEILITNELIDE